MVITDAKTEIAKFNLADAGIAELKKKYKGLKVKDKDDQSGITKVTEAYRDVVKVRTTLEKKRKEVKEPYIKIGKDIDEEAKRLTNLILDVENPLKSEYEKIKQWEKEEEERKEAERLEKIKKRVGELTGAGLVFNGEFYVINEISMDIVTIEKMSEAEGELEGKAKQSVRNFLKDASLAQIQCKMGRYCSSWLGLRCR